MAPDFWWDLTPDRNASIKTVLPESPTLEGRTDPKTGFALEWYLGWAKGETCVWSAGGSANWVVWTWEATNDSGKLCRCVHLFLLGKGKVIPVLS